MPLPTRPGPRHAGPVSDIRFVVEAQEQPRRRSSVAYIARGLIELVLTKGQTARAAEPPPTTQPFVVNLQVGGKTAVSLPASDRAAADELARSLQEELAKSVDDFCERYFVPSHYRARLRQG
jgi:hypothetical protein